MTTPSAKRMMGLHAAYVKAQAGGITKNVSELQTTPGGALPDKKKLGSKAQLEMRFGKKPTKPAKGPTANDAGQMNSSSSGSAMGPAYMR